MSTSAQPGAHDIFIDFYRLVHSPWVRVVNDLTDVAFASIATFRLGHRRRDNNAHVTVFGRASPSAHLSSELSREQYVPVRNLNRINGAQSTTIRFLGHIALAAS